MVVALPENEAQVRRSCTICHALERAGRARAAPAPVCRAARCRIARRDAVAGASSTASSRIDADARTAVVQSRRAQSRDLRGGRAATACTTRPIRRSQIACTIGGNVAENSGGVHCLKYGLTVHNVLRVRGFTIEGEAVELGSEALDAPGLRPAGVCHRLAKACSASSPR